MLALPLAAPALPLDDAGKYVAGAYVVFLALLLIYLAIMSIRLGRIDREIAEIAELAEERRAGASADPDTPGREAEDVAGVSSSSRQEVL